MWLLYLALIGAVVVVPIWVIARIVAAGRDIRRLLHRIEALEGRVGVVVRAVRDLRGQESDAPEIAEAKPEAVPQPLPPPPPRPRGRPSARRRSLRRRRSSRPRPPAISSSSSAASGSRTSAPCCCCSACSS